MVGSSKFQEQMNKLTEESAEQEQLVSKGPTGPMGPTGSKGPKKLNRKLKLELSSKESKESN